MSAWLVSALEVAFVLVSVSLQCKCRPKQLRHCGLCTVPACLSQNLEDWSVDLLVTGP